MSGVNNNSDNNMSETEVIGANSPEVELCVTCGEDTPYTRQTNVQLRYWYVEGAGQLCQKCYTNVYDPTN